MDVKNILLSKTLWLNLLGPVFAWLATKGIDLDADTQTAVIVVLMAGLNIIMRRFTSKPVTLSAPIGKGTVGALLAMVCALAIVTGLSACNPSQVQTSLGDLKTGCAALAIAENASLLTGGAAQTAAKVQAPFDAFCRIVDSGIMPGNADANSLAWVQTGATTVSTIVALAKSP